MLHGFPQNLTMWATVAPLLAAAGFTTICADLRDYGNSAKPHCLADRSNYAFRAMAADQAALMIQLGFPRFHMVGHDSGGRTGHRMALCRALDASADTESDGKRDSRARRNSAPTSTELGLLVIKPHLEMTFD